MQVTDCIVEAGGSGKTTVPTGQYLSTKFNACIVEAGGSANYGTNFSTFVHKVIRAW